MMAVRLRRYNAPGGQRDSNLRAVSFHFGHPWPGEKRPLLYARNRYERSNDRDGLTGVIYPSSQLRTDDTGQLVADMGRAGMTPHWLIK